MAVTTVFFDLGDTLVFDDPAGVRQRFADALDCLQILRARGYRIGLLSNQAAGTTVAQVTSRLAALGLGTAIEPALITLSSEIAGNVGKPARPVYDLALAKAGHAAASAQSIFITEDAAHVAAARGFGWRALLLKRSGGACLAADGECVLSLAALLSALPALASAAALAGANLELAPPARLVDGLWAVPIDISRITARLVFDAATSSASADASLDFQLGVHAGCPIFDLRQTPTAAWLDGVALPVADMAAHDFGGGAQAGLRVVARVLEAGTTHTLRITYALGTPQASTAGSYLPQITWSAGPRLVFNFGFTDLGPGRYLEAFVPANLVFDQFELDLDIELQGSAVAHTLISNGNVSSLGANHWRAQFPASSTALSPLIELRASNTLVQASFVQTLPVSGTAVTVQAWKLGSSAVDVAAQAAALGGFLAANEASSGRYRHGARFTAFVHQGGMEYDGATTSGTGALRHEAYHSWWGRGLKPASQVDGWFDEAWTVYQGNGASAVVPLNFADPPVALSPRNPWVRSTPSTAYTAGERLWQGLAAMMGAANLVDLMNAFYNAHPSRPATTEALECHLLARSGQAGVVDAFHRFVYGLPEAKPLPELWLRDEVGDSGAEPWAGRFWDSPDLWVRNADDGGLTHQNPEFGQDNWIHARVRNRSTTTTARHFAVSFNFKSYAGTQFSYPTDFLPALAAAAGFELGPGESRIVKVRWPRKQVPPVGTHPCLLAAVFSRADAPQAGRFVWQQNNLAQKNLSIVDLSPNRWLVWPVLLTNLRARAARQIELELRRPPGWPKLEAQLIVEKAALNPVLRSLAVPLAARSAAVDATAYGREEGAAALGQVLDCGCLGAVSHSDSDAAGSDLRYAASVLTEFPRAVETPFAVGETARLGVKLRAGESLRVGVRVTVPAQVRPGDILLLDLLQREGRKVVGGVALRVQVPR